MKLTLLSLFLLLSIGVVLLALGERLAGPQSRYYPGGAVQGKVTDSQMARAMTFMAHAGHPCGADFNARQFLAAHPEYNWEASILRDMKAGPWTMFHAGQRAER